MQGSAGMLRRPYVDSARKGDAHGARSAALTARHARWAAACAAAVGLSGLAGRLLELRLLSSYLPAAPTMTLNSALCVLSLAAALATWTRLQSEGPANPRVQRLARTLSGLALGVAGVTVLEWLSGRNLGIDELLMPDLWARAGDPPGRPSPFMAVALSLLAMALWLGPRHKRAWLFQLGTLTALTGSWFVLVTFLYGSGLVTRLPGLHAFTLPSALSMLALAYGTLWLRPEEGLVRALSSDGLAGMSARRLMPVGAALPLVLGWMRLLAETQGWLSPALSLSLFITAVMLGFVFLAWINARNVERLEQHRETAREATDRLTQRLQLATQAAGIGVWDYDVKTDRAVWDASMYALYGIEEGSVEGTRETWRTLVASEDRDAAVAAFERALERCRAGEPGAEQLQTEFRVRRPDGSLRTLSANMLIQRDANGEPERVIGTNLDVTAQREADARLAASERKFRGIFDSMYQFMGLLDPRGNVIEANRAALAFIDQPLEAVAGKPFWEAPWWAYSADVQARVRDAVLRAADGEFVRYQPTVCGAAGRTLTIDFSLKPVFDEQGEVVLLIPEGRDVSEAVAARTALEESEQRFRSAVEFSPIGKALVALDGHFLEVNRSLCEMVGYSEAELLARDFQSITHPEDLEPDLAQAEALLSGRITHYQMQKRYIHQQGHTVWVDLSGSLVRSADGSPRMFIAELQDITERKAAEERIQASLEEKEVLLREIHHRVKNNLQVVASILRLASEQMSGAQERAMFLDCQTRVHTMGLLHERLYRSKDMSKIDFAAHLRELSDMLLRSYGRAGRPIALELRLEPVHVDMDTAVPLGLICNELITNCLKYAYETERGGRLLIRIACQNDVLTLEVADDGTTGTFPSAEALTSSKSLGLRLVRSLVRQLRGEVHVQRDEMNRFILTLPAASEDRHALSA